MSHQTGIKASDTLRGFFAKAKDGSVRCMKIVICKEQLELDKSLPPSSSWEQDYDQLVPQCIEPKAACYIIYRFDKSDNQGYHWLLISYTAENAPVRLKMLYAATRATLKQEFGGGQIKDELNGNDIDEVNFNGYQNHVAAKNAPAPLTMAEEELAEIKRNEVETIGHGTKQAMVGSGLSFPFEQQAFDKLQELEQSRINYVQLSLDIKREQVLLELSENINVDQIASFIPTDHGRYHFYKYSHTHEGDYITSTVFIFSMPGGKCPIKERMLYSSLKAAVIDFAEQQVGLEVDRKVEVDEPNDVNETFIYDAVHPKKDIIRQKFSKPKGPTGRGPKRMTRNQPT